MCLCKCEFSQKYFTSSIVYEYLFEFIFFTLRPHYCDLFLVMICCALACVIYCQVLVDDKIIESVTLSLVAVDYYYKNIESIGKNLILEALIYCINCRDP